MNRESFKHYELGIPQIDEEHWEIIVKLESIRSLCVDHRAVLICERINELHILLQQHFKSEEKLLEEYFFPFVDSHKESHTKILDDFEDLKKKFQDNYLKVKYFSNLNQFLMTNFLFNLSTHFDFMDQQYVPYLKNGSTICSILKKWNSSRMIQKRADTPTGLSAFLMSSPLFIVE